MTDETQEELWAREKAECLARYQRRAKRRIQMAQAILSGRLKWNPNWPDWARFDILAECDRLQADRKRAAIEAKRRKREHEKQKQAQQDLFA